MKSLLTTLLVTLTLANAQGQFSDDFTDLDFTNSPTWTGNTTFFTAATGVLQSQSSGAANYFLSTPSTLVNDAQWEFFVDLRFASSGANYTDIYLMSNGVDLSSGVNGYYLRMGGTADRLELFRSTAGTGTSTTLQSPDGVVNSSTSNPFRIKVTRSSAGEWQLFYDDGATGSYTSAGTITDNNFTSASHFGIRIEQSTAASAVNNHYFDDFVVGAIPVDLTPPSIVSVTAISATEVDVLYSEPIDPAFIGTYDILPFIGVASQILDGTSPNLVHVTPAIALTSGSAYQLSVADAQDPTGNVYAGPAAINFSYVVPEAASFRDVVINELMADPTPVVGLPEVEFVEVLNTTTSLTFDLAGWMFSDGGTPVVLPSYLLGPGEYVLLMANASLPFFPTVSNKIGLTSLPALNNDGDALVLKDDNANTIDAVTYALSWYQDAAKSAGGWTLEQIDPTSPCSGASNWRASNAPVGGTPGVQNSIYAIVPDMQPPSLLAVQVPDEMTLGLVFSEAMDATSLVGGNYFITPSIGTGDVFPNGTTGATINLLQPLVVGTVYTIVVEDVSDCPGNLIAANNTATFALPEPVAVGDVVINEVLYDPFGTGSDFVEIYNRSQKTLSMAGWGLANVSNGAVSAGLPITTSSFLLLPGEYALVCESTLNIVSNYPQSHADRFIETDLPSYNNGTGSVVLLDPTGTQLDRFNYSDDLHFALVNNTEGYSLERVDPDRPTSDDTNWQTAADIAGKATPGFQNSQYAKAPEASGEIIVNPAIFSPDNDGYQDLLTIGYRFQEPGFVGNMTVYDLAGREARKLMESQLLGTSGAISWDGLLEGGSLGRMGPYIILLEVFDLQGNVERYKQTVTLAHRLN